MVLKRKIEQVIEKGGHVSADNNAEFKEWTNFTLRIKMGMLLEIKDEVDNSVGISKTGWILQAIDEKLRKQNVTD